MQSTNSYRPGGSYPKIINITKLFINRTKKARKINKFRRLWSTMSSKKVNIMIQENLESFSLTKRAT